MNCIVWIQTCVCSWKKETPQQAVSEIEAGPICLLVRVDSQLMYLAVLGSTSKWPWGNDRCGFHNLATKAPGGSLFVFNPDSSQEREGQRGIEDSQVWAKKKTFGQAQVGKELSDDPEKTRTRQRRSIRNFHRTWSPHWFRCFAQSCRWKLFPCRKLDRGVWVAMCTCSQARSLHATFVTGNGHRRGM